MPDIKIQVKAMFLPASAALVLAGLVAFWIFQFHAYRVEPRVAGLDGRPAPAQADASGASKLPQGTLETFDGVPSQVTASWPQFRGPAGTGIITTDVPLATGWPASGPKKLWQHKLGDGYAAPVIHNGRVYLIDYDMPNEADAIRCFSLDDGREIWRFSYPVKIKRNHGMSRTIPAVTDDYLVTIGPKCHVTCLDAKTGEMKWMIDMVSQFGTKEPLWYAGQCPLIVDGQVILAPAGPDVLMTALDIATGQIAWTCPNESKWQMTHCSILPMTFAGKDMYVYPASGGVAGVDARTGQLLWQTTAWYLRVNVPTPVDAGDGRIFLSAGYNKGSMMLQLNETDGRIEAQPLFDLKPTVFGADQQTPIFYENHIFGVRPGGQLVCMDLTGNILWTSGPEHRFGLGPYIIVNGLMYIIDDDGMLSVIEATSQRFNLLTRARVLDGHECWGPPAFAAGRLLVRDLTTLVCLDVSQ
jgi:outer membrane protein assembly factor BamB